MNVFTTPRRVLRTPSAAEYTGFSISFLEKARLSGRGPVYIKVGRGVGYDISDLDRWLNDQKRSNTSEAA